MGFSCFFIPLVSQFKVGPGLDVSSTHGPVIHSRAMNKVQSHIDDAISKGAKLALGGHALPELGPNFYAPTVLVDVPLTGTLMDSEETFGPVAGLMRFSSEEQLLERANDTQYGLAGYFFTKDVGRAFRVAEELECGMVGVSAFFSSF